MRYGVLMSTSRKPFFLLPLLVGVCVSDGENGNGLRRMHCSFHTSNVLHPRFNGIGQDFTHTELPIVGVRAATDVMRECDRNVEKNWRNWSDHGETWDPVEHRNVQSYLLLFAKLLWISERLLRKSVRSQLKWLWNCSSNFTPLHIAIMS